MRPSPEFMKKHVFGTEIKQEKEEESKAEVEQKRGEEKEKKA